MLIRHWLSYSHPILNPSHCTPDFLCHIPHSLGLFCLTTIMNGSTKKCAKKLGLFRRFKPLGLFKVHYLPPFHPSSASVTIPRDHTFSSHPSFRFGSNCVIIERIGRPPTISKHVPERYLSLYGTNTPLYAPDENGGFSWWADPLTTVTYSLIPLERSPRHTHVLFLSLYIPILSLPWFFVIMYLFYNFT